MGILKKLGRAWKKVAKRLGENMTAVQQPVSAGDASKPRGVAAKRLARAGRIPFNLWGDIFLDGSAPQVRRALVGQEAHESLLSFFYLGEILTLDEVVQALPAIRSNAAAWPSGILDRYSILKKASGDPLSQLNDEVLQVFVPVTSYLDRIGADQTELCELGCTFFSAVEKVKICAALLGSGLDIPSLRFVAVDHSDHFLRGAKQFHRGDRLTALSDYDLWAPSTPHPIHLSRFVASYALPSTRDFADWMAKFSAFHVIDVFNIGDGDFRTSNNGLRQIFFNLPDLVDSLNASGWDVFANSVEPDFNSGRRCAIAKIFAIKRGVEQRIQVVKAIQSQAELVSLLPMRRLTRVTAIQALKEAEARLTQAEWGAFAEYKKHFPIWGRPVAPVASTADVDRLVALADPKINLSFGMGQLSYYLNTVPAADEDGEGA